MARARQRASGLVIIIGAHKAGDRVTRRQLNAASHFHRAAIDGTKDGHNLC